MADTASAGADCSMKVQHEIDNFRVDFKYYKMKKPPPNLSDVIEFGCTKNEEILEVILEEPPLPSIIGIKPVEEWKAFTHTSLPGFYFIKSVFQPGFQQYWVKRCLQDFPNKPNISNLDAQSLIEESDNFWGQRNVVDSKGKDLLHKIRWVTLGYHHDWDTKKYKPESHSHFPNDIWYLSKFLGTVLGFPNFVSEAAIINYYHLDSTLSGHTDHSEFDDQAPLISISFGQPGIFLLGGLDKSVKPLAMFLRSGDIVVMSKECRLAYHAIPKIFPISKEELETVMGSPLNVQYKSRIGLMEDEETTNSNKDQKLGYRCANSNDKSGNIPSGATAMHCSCLNTCTGVCRTSVISPTTLEDQNFQTLADSVNKHIEVTMESTEWDDYMSYLYDSRINMNVRQVFPTGKSFSNFI